MAVSALPARRDFDAVFEKPDAKVGNSDLLVLARKSQHSTTHRVGFVTSKKKIKRAVDRNRFRRVIRDCLRRNHSDIKAVDYVVIAKKIPQHLWNAQFNLTVTEILRKLFHRIEPNE